MELETMPDYVHLLVEVDPQYGVHKLVKAIKGRTSRVLREEFPWLKTRLPTLWTNAYLVTTVGVRRCRLSQATSSSRKRGEAMLTGRKYRLAFTPEQAEFAETVGGICRSVWNTALEQRREYRRRVDELCRPSR